ncbi:MAG TPA: aldo/keto reductase, partial [Methanocorpusculum sp.]|nr:aldo/keto reductase [Methanocorpusculum sp.]
AYGTAEHVLNCFLSQPIIQRNEVRIISKTKSADEQMLNDAKCSLENIGVQYLDGCLLHDADLVFSKAAVSNLKLLKETGISKEIGVSVYTPEQAVKALDYDFIDIIQVPYNILDRRLDKSDFFAGAKEIGLNIYVRSVLLQGLLMMNPDTLPKKMKFAESYIRKYQRLCRQNSLGFFETAVGYVLQHENIDYIVFGVDNLSQLNEYINLYSNPTKKDILKIFSSVFNNVDEKVIMPNLWNK